MTITEFLLARIAEDEAAARAAGDDRADDVLGAAASEGASSEGLDHFERWLPSIVLAECEAKRRIVYRSMNGYPPAPDYERGWREGLDRSLRDLAAIYAGHPDYDPTWALR